MQKTSRSSTECPRTTCTSAGLRSSFQTRNSSTVSVEPDPSEPEPSGRTLGSREPASPAFPPFHGDNLDCVAFSHRRDTIQPLGATLSLASGLHSDDRTRSETHFRPRPLQQTPLMPDLNPEQVARQQIDAQLVACGWLVQDYRAVDFSAGRGIAIREVPLKTGPCDYLLLVDRRALGVIEAK